MTLSSFRVNARRAAALCIALASLALSTVPALAQDADALFAQGQRYLEIDNRDDARIALRAACELDHAEACKAYGEQMNVGSFFSDPVSMENRAWAFGRACDLGDGEGCLELGDARTPLGMFGAPRTPENWAASADAYRRGCDDHDVSEACFRAGEVLSHGSNPSRDAMAGRTYHERACALAFEPACDGLGTRGAAAAPSPADAAAEADAMARDHEARLGATDGMVRVGPELYRALADISQRTGAMMRSGVINAIERHVFADGVLSEEERELLIELTAPRSTNVTVALTGGQARDLSIMPAFGQQRAAMVARVEQAAPASSLTWDAADRPGTMRRLFEARLRAPQLEPRARGLIAEEVAQLAAASTVENGYGPLRGFITESLAVTDDYEGEENDAVRGLLYDSIVQGVEGAPLTMPRFLFNWIRPGGHAGPDRPRPQERR